MTGKGLYGVRSASPSWLCLWRAEWQLALDIGPVQRMQTNNCGLGYYKVDFNPAVSGLEYMCVEVIFIEKNLSLALLLRVNSELGTIFFGL